MSKQTILEKAASKVVLVIDDEYAIRVIVQTALEMSAGWQVLLADTAAEGLQIANDEAPDAILLDVMMPDTNGTDAIKALQANPRTEVIPVIFFTAKVRNDEYKALERLGAAGIITKPFEPDVIAQNIKTLLNWSD